MKKYLKKRMNETVEKRNKMSKEIKTLNTRADRLSKKIKEEDIIEKVVVFESESSTVSKMRVEESRIIMDKGWGVSPENEEESTVTRVLRKGSKIICTIYDSKTEANVLGIGISKCHWEDDFDYIKGIGIAELRAKQDMLKRKESVFYNEN